MYVCMYVTKCFAKFQIENKYVGTILASCDDNSNQKPNTYECVWVSNEWYGLNRKTLTALAQIEKLRNRRNAFILN